jgi:DNA-binding CsgD family transcriptional regulator
MADEIEIEPEVVVEAAAPVAEAPSAEPEPASDNLSVPEDYVLNPRQRRLAMLLAQGEMTRIQMAKALGYSEQNITLLKKSPAMIAEIRRNEERIYEDTVKARLKSMATPAMDHLNFVLMDRTNKVKVSEKNDVAKWLIEKIDGKAAQVHDVGENLLGVMMDRLDALRGSGKTLNAPIDVTGTAQIEAPKEKTEEDLLAEWVTANPLD